MGQRMIDGNAIHEQEVRSIEASKPQKLPVTDIDGKVIGIFVADAKFTPYLNNGEVFELHPMVERRTDGGPYREFCVSLTYRPKPVPPSR